MVCEQTVSNKAQVGQEFLHQGSLLRIEDPVIFWVYGLDYQPALLSRMTRIPKLYIHRQFRGELCFPDTPTILHAAKALLRYCHMQLARCFHSLFCQNCCGFPVALIRRRERVFRCCSVCETIGDYKEGYLMVWTFHMCPCSSIVVLYF